MSKYQGHAVAEIGTNGTGKSTWMKKVMDSHPRDVLLLMDDDSEDLFDYLTEIRPDQISRFRGQAVCFVDPDDKKEMDYVFNQIYDHLGKQNGVFQGALLCIDDAMSILSAQPRPALKRVFKKRRQRRLDIILNCHGASEFPVSLFKNMTDFLIFKTVDSTKNITGRMNGEMAESFVKAINMVNQKALSNPYYSYNFNLKNPPKL